MNPAQTNRPETKHDWIPQWLAERGFHSTGPGTFSNGRAQFQILGNQLTALPGNGTVAWRGDVTEADSASAFAPPRAHQRSLHSTPSRGPTTILSARSSL